MDEQDVSEAVVGAGLVFCRMADQSAPFIPPVLATFATATPPGEGRMVATVNRDDPELIARANADWNRLCLEGGLFNGEEPRFLVAVDCAAGCDRAVWRWAEVGLSDSWDIVGTGASGILGNGYGKPAFVMLSLAGDVVVRGDTWENEIGTVLVREPYRHQPFSQHGEWMITRSTTGEWEKAAIRRWLDAQSPS